ncbi:MAG: rRNA pseudouridine synthase [Candidatus Magasanikbacteria bacterium]|jgi:23S rRNA pseudouridine2605 synthase|nr:rRNA pseudouridine synthase [Candidatus Magasanikbacteria bacterium]
MIRLQKHIADLGICSRRKAEVLIAAGLVKVNGKAVTELGTKVDPITDVVDVLHSPAPKKVRTVYIALHKPVDVISSASSEQGTSVVDLITPENYLKQKYKDEAAEKIDGARLYPVGRLDKDSEGLVIMTNDGDLTNKMTHPSFKHEKEYDITIEKPLSQDAIKVLEKGMEIDDEFVPGIKVVNTQRHGRKAIISVVLMQGKNRQLRKMFGRLGYHVESLRRTRMGGVTLGTIPQGRWKFVEKSMLLHK